MPRLVLTLGLVALLSLMACGNSPTPTIPVPTPSVSSNLGSCPAQADRAQYIGDDGPKDESIVAAGAKLTVTYTLKNLSPEPWTPECYSVVRVRTNFTTETPDKLDLPSTIAPGNTGNIVLKIRMPNGPCPNETGYPAGLCVLEYRVSGPQGAFADSFWLRVYIK